MVSFPIIVDTKIIFIRIMHTAEIIVNVFIVKCVYNQILDYNFSTKCYRYVIYNIIHSTKVSIIN